MTLPHGAPRAVLFDLFNTLIPGGAPAERDAVSRAMAADLGVAPDEFVRLYRRTFDERARGRLGDLHEAIRALARLLGADPSEERVAAAVARRLDFTLSLHGATWAVPALRAIRRAGYRIGLVSDCTAETPLVWQESPLAAYVEATSFSCETGIRKPAAEAYLVAVEGLGVSPTECVYVGDGGSGELTGAAELGMRAVRYLPGDPPDGVIDGEEWSGEVVADLEDLLPLIRGDADHG